MCYHNLHDGLGTVMMIDRIRFHEYINVSDDLLMSEPIDLNEFGNSADMTFDQHRLVNIARQLII